MYCVKFPGFFRQQRIEYLFAPIFILLAFGCTLSFAAGYEPNSVSNYSGQSLFKTVRQVYTADKVVTEAPLIDKDNVVLKTKVGVEVFNIKTDQTLWSYRTETILSRKLFVSNGVVYWVEGENILCALSIKDGKEVWKKKLEVMDKNVEPVFYQNKIFLKTEKNTLALDVKSGNIVWSFNYGPDSTDPILAKDQIVVCGIKKPSLFQKFFTLERSSNFSCINPEDGHVFSEHELSGHVLMATFDDSKLYCYNLHTPIPSDLESERPPGFMPFIGCPSLECRNIDNGSMVWQMLCFGGSAGFNRSKLHLWRRYIYLFNSSLLLKSKKMIGRNTLHKIDAETGNIVWQIEFELGNYRELIVPVFFPGILIFSNGKSLYALSANNGEILSQWQGDKVSQITQKNNEIIWADGRKIFALDCSEYNTDL